MRVHFIGAIIPHQFGTIDHAFSIVTIFKHWTLLQIPKSCLYRKC